MADSDPQLANRDDLRPPAAANASTPTEAERETDCCDCRRPLQRRGGEVAFIHCTRCQRRAHANHAGRRGLNIQTWVCRQCLGVAPSEVGSFVGGGGAEYF